jgi:predicted amidohydrolase
MKISLLQMHIKFGDFAENKRTIVRLLEEAMPTNPDIIVLPEMWNVGFYPKPVGEYADPDGSDTRKFLSKLAKEHQINIVGGSIANRIGERVYNTSYVFNRDGELVSTYHKTHLFSPAQEDIIFTPGEHFNTYVLDGVKCATIICYDLRFCELVRLLALEKISVLFIPAAWPIERLMHWQTLTRARAIENQIFVIAANGSGILDMLQLAGNSMIIDPWGEILAKADESEQTLHANLKLAILQDIRSSMNIFQDRKPKLYEQ